MGASAQVDPIALAQGSTTGLNRGAGRMARALDKLRRPWKTEGAYFPDRELPLADTGDVLGRVGSAQFPIAGRVRNRQLMGGDQGRLKHPFTKSCVLCDGEAMTGRQRENEPIGVENLQDSVS